ncbi:MAG: inosine/guanosine kinase [Bdellovibrionales bacterium GWC1_52_8]|nr:MAG: inosine/guanosine kinase [Bdellovibrionales bacterium GWB1_52_6]OFZ05482.1 MAG: inosine/guanosine kinase [Bdellovibrionales bacterium GWA1_52_35]OFZ38414.1 MAG: inosine/guanosine kinase [Bdellovibrionales bacterium GWC1_52_8]HCM39153.1 inosine/guanosine kinase [Bdellovibrionales bacterium]
MKFPGKRKSKHYFPVTDKGRIPFGADVERSGEIYIVGMDQLLVDIEARVEESFLAEIGITKGESVLLDDVKVDQIYSRLKEEDRIVGEFAGGAIGNTIHNYSVLADDQSYLLGTITKQINMGDYAFHYIRNTSSRVNLSHLHPCSGPMGRAICFITPDGERSFGIGRGIMDELPAEAISEKLISKASALVLTAYLFRKEDAPIFRATMRALECAKRHNIPIILALGTESLVREKREFLRDLISSSVNILAGNFQELGVLTGQSDALLAGQDALDLADLVLMTHDRHGLYLCGHVDEEFARVTKDQIHSKSIPEYNRHEYSRAMLKSECKKPLKMYSHINPYLGGPSTIRNTNGAGDSALSALLHDLAANIHHRHASPTSPKHKTHFLTYSSIHQICKYANRVSYEVLRRSSPRLSQGLPEREDSLEVSYWEK